MNIYSGSVFLFSFGILLIAVLAFAKRINLIAIRFAFFSISACGWGGVWAIWTSMTGAEHVIFNLVRLSHLFAVFIPVTWLHFVCEFTRADFKSRKTIFAALYTASSLLALCTFTPLFLPGLHPIKELRYFPSPGPLYHVFSIFFFTLVGMAFLKLLTAYSKTTGDFQSQIRYLAIGAGFGFFSGSATFLPVYGISVPLEIVFLMPLYPFFVGNALVRYGLFDAREIADAFQREKMAVLGTMAASLNHEIRNPLYVVRGKAEGYLDALEQDKYASREEVLEASKSTIKPILNQAMRALDIIQRFTDFARPFNVKASRERVVLREVFQDVQELISSELRDGQIQLSHNLTNGLAVYANRRHVEEIFSNLVMNACHATGEKGGQIKVNAPT